MPLRIHHSATLRAAFALALLAPMITAAGPGPSTARAGTPEQDSLSAVGARVSSYAPALKILQQRLLLQGAQARMARAKALTRQLRKHPEGARRGAAVRRAGDGNETGGPQGTGAPGSGARAASPARATAALVPDALVNNRAQDAGSTGVGQSEEMIAALGSNVLVAWNDGLGFTTSPYTSTQGYAYSVDGGANYTDGGSPPVPAGWRWASDPLVTVDEKTGDFWFCALVDDNSTRNGIGLAKARFNAGTVQWSPPVLVRYGNNSSVFFDKPWIAADSLSGRLYLSYTVFGVSADTIVFQRSSVGGATWDNPQRLSSNAEAGYVQGSRPAVGPGGEVYVTWYSIETASPYADHMMIRTSANQGTSFGAAVTAASVYSNFGSGAPGFNRGIGITYPSIAVDRSSGAHRGRIYVAWNESVDFYDDGGGLGATGPVSESEPNDTPATADPFTPGKILRGSLPSYLDLDYFSFTGTAGQTLIFYADSITSSLSMSLRVYCSDGTTRLALSAPGTGQNNFICFTLPVTGTYYVRCASWDGSTGSYKISTGLDTPTPGERARDHRDVFVAWSDGGATWSTPAMASDSPVGYDDWLPEVAVGGNHPDPRVGDGRPYCIWYDWRGSASTCGGGSNINLSRLSDDGGTWIPVGALGAVQTAWTSVASNITPNQGDYLSLCASGTNLYAAWADGRNGDPDIYAATVPLLTTDVDVSLASVQATSDRVTLTWYAGGLGDGVATIERRENTTSFTPIGTASADGVGNLSFVDAAVSPGARYAYRLTWVEGAATRSSDEVWVDVPVAAGVALALYGDNPVGPDVRVSLRLPDAAPATLELFDVAGRQLASRQVQGAGEHARVSLSEGLALDSGIYFVRLTHGGASLTRRVALVRTGSGGR
jgi:hypothetical protein